jgi:hypothetical protein
MNEVSNFTKMEPNQKVERINEFIQLLQDKTEDETNEKWSSKKNQIFMALKLFQKNYLKHIT